MEIKHTEQENVSIISRHSTTRTKDTKAIKPKLRIITEADATAFLQMLLQLDQETKHMMYEPGERPQNLERILSNIKAAGDNGDLLLGVFHQDACLGFLSASRGEYHRIRHSSYVVIGLLKQAQGLGLGSRLFEELIHWAKQSKVTRLELTVMCHNKEAFALYQKYGFEIEGVKRNSLIVEGSYVDEYYMARLL